MKYIRTKDGDILSLNEFKYVKKYHWYHPNEKYLSRLDIGFIGWNWCFDDEYDLIPDVLGKIMVKKIKRKECKFSDTIEELCDEFVMLRLKDELNDNEPIIFKHLDLAKSYFKKYLGYAIYGAIWTDKGLTYVAKLNEVGKLCLL